MRKLINVLIVIASFTLTACSTVIDNIPWVYSLDIEQGNIIDQEMIDQLRPNMTKRQVLYIMGSSMLIDVFHQKRWDYLYSEQPGGGPRSQKRLSLYFDGDQLIGVQGDFKPSTLPVIRESKETTVVVPARDHEKTLWEKITGLFDDDIQPQNKKEIIQESNAKAETEELEDSVKEPIDPVLENISGELITEPLEPAQNMEQLLEQSAVEIDQGNDKANETTEQINNKVDTELLTQPVEQRDQEKTED